MKALALVLFALLTLPLAAQDAIHPTQSPSDSLPRIAEHMPLFLTSECPPDAPYPSRKSCSDKAMVEYVYSNLQYPQEANDLTGPAKMAVVNFVVEPDGSITNVEVYRDPGYGMGAEALRIVQQMGREGKWSPAMQEGKPIRLLMQLPIKFTKP